MQQIYSSVAAVHTDSILSTIPILGDLSDRLGSFTLQEQGQGLILGAGIYELGDTIGIPGRKL